ncbi:MAG: hypothetical protein HUJ93_02025 [Bacteroidales bacterium]|nr:hypothetical protein [Bacteroidales bacterium]
MVTILAFASCRYLHPEDEPLAKVGENVLYAGQVLKLLPEGVSEADSAAMVRQYIENWALGHLMLLKAQEQLSKEDMDVSREIEQYRRDLLSFRYQKNYVESRIDTAVSEADIKLYYQEHPQAFSYDYSVVKARVVTISRKSPYYSNIKSLFTTQDEEKESELASLCRSYAERYEDFNGEWVALSQVARIADIDLESCEKIFSKSGSSHIKEGEEKNTLIYIVERIAPETLSPLEYNKEKIVDAIISQNKQEILAKLERDLLDDAVANKTLKIY